MGPTSSSRRCGTGTTSPSSTRTRPRPAGDNPRTFGSEQPNVPQDDFVAQPAPLGRFCSGTLTDRAASSTTSAPAAATSAGSTSRTRRPASRAARSGRSRTARPSSFPALGLFSWENVVPAANRSDTTLVMGNEDTVGRPAAGLRRRQAARGDAFDRAGLTNGVNHVIDLVDESVSGEADLPRQVRRGHAGRVRPRRGRLGSVGRRAERRGGGRRPDAEPHRGRRLGPAQPVGLLLHDHRRRRHQRAGPRAASATRAASGDSRSRTSSGPGAAAR